MGDTVLDVVAVADRMRRRFGDDVAAWAAELPDRLDRLANAWGLTFGRMFPQGSSAVTLRAVRAGTPVVVKVSPDAGFLAEQVRVLRAFEPSGRVPRVLADDPAEAAVLLELVPGRKGWPAADRFGPLLRELHAAVAEPEAVADRELSSWVAEVLARFGPTGPVTADDLARSADRCAGLLATARRPVLLHGDLTVDNLLDAGAARVVVIDPKACLGEPEFDAVEYVLAGRDIETRRDALLATSGLDAERLDGWCRAMAPIVAAVAVGRGALVDELLAYGRG